MSKRGALALAALLAGLAALFIPTFIDLARGAWRDDEHAHGPMILAIAAYLGWRARGALSTAQPARIGGALLLAFGLLAWLLGRTQSLMPVEAGALIPVAVGLVLLVWGTPGARTLAFPLAFLAFYVPLPGFFLEAATAPLKHFVSAAVAPLLGLAGYSVERAGVVLFVEGQELLVADACSGMNSIVSLLAMGLLYAHLTGARAARSVLLTLAVVPIAIIANILRVFALVLVAVHVGPDAAQGWVHDALGLAVFVVALLLIVGLDRMMGKWGQVGFRTRPQYVEMGTGSKTNLTPFAAAAAMLAIALVAPALKPTQDPAALALDLEGTVPVAFAGWRVDPDEAPIALTSDVQANLDRLYRQVVARTYVNDRGERIMLTIAHGGDQSDALKAHRQEACYRAQGFSVGDVQRGSIQASGHRLDVTRFLAVRGERIEPVTYWFTMGDRVVLGRLERLQVQLANGLRGRIPDGMLVRVSSLDTDPARAHAAQAAFVAALAGAVPERHAARFVGAVSS